ncbi:MAG: hypothetical protein J1G38_01670 [Clostridiales bacterium]|nr:hypothetical protein [Clostridiales bacterium]
MFDRYIEYGLHDTFINDIIINKNGLTFSFCNGVYILDDTGKESYLSKPCKMNIYVDDFDINRLFEHCSFYKCHKNRWAEVDLADIKDLLLKNHFAVNLDFYSPFAQAISLQGNIGKYLIEIRITEIKNIEFEI